MHAKHSGKGTVTGQSSLSLEQISQLEIPLPPLDEQRRIAAILDKADALRRKRKRALDLLDSLTQSIFIELFGDPLSNDDEIVPLRKLRRPVQEDNGLIAVRT